MKMRHVKMLMYLKCYLNKWEYFTFYKYYRSIYFLTTNAHELYQYIRFSYAIGMLNLFSIPLQLKITSPFSMPLIYNFQCNFAFP